MDKPYYLELAAQMLRDKAGLPTPPKIDRYCVQCGRAMSPFGTTPDGTHVEFMDAEGHQTFVPTRILE